MSRSSIVLSSAVMLAVSGCVSLPTGPSVMVLPGNGVSFDQFRIDDATCQQYAYAQIGGTTAEKQAERSGVTSAAIGTALGAAAGAAIGGGQGAAIGAGSGLLGGSVVGAGTADSSMYGTQDRYNIAYIQCMYSKGHKVPVSGQFSNETYRPAAPSSSTIPPPPPGSPPPAPKK
ncbi:MAG: YMGG-like glycine zipper-containing protein [Methylobacter sp.]